MNRSNYFNYIEEKLNILSCRIKRRGMFNLLELNIHSEFFFADLVNHLLNYSLTNLNQEKSNVESIDLIDNKNKIIVQVSAVCNRKKIEDSLTKIPKDYFNYHFIFIAISGEADRLRTKDFANPHNVKFSPSNDIYDIKSLLSIVLDIPIQEQRKLYDFVRAELGNNGDIVKVDTNLASIINILSKENLSVEISEPEVNSFEILKKIEFNELLEARSTIDHYKIYYSRLDKIYQEFDKHGANKSLSVLSFLHSRYARISEKTKNPHEIFFSIIDDTVKTVENSNNYAEIPYEELEMCVSILVVDSFVRCKIFKNPEGYSHAITR